MIVMMLMTIMAMIVITVMVMAIMTLAMEKIRTDHFKTNFQGRLFHILRLKREIF